MQYTRPPPIVDTGDYSQIEGMHERYSIRNMVNDSEGNILEIKRRLPRSKNMRKHLIRSGSLSNENINKASGISSTMSQEKRRHAVLQQYKSKNKAG
jgi:hypothetical protein